MGQSGAAVYWEDDRNDWSNPALLAYEQGIRYSRARFQLLPDLANDVFFTADHVAAGACGVGVSITGKPFSSLGGYQLDYGVSYATNENGDIIGTFHSYENVRQIGVGLSPIKLYDSLRRQAGLEPSALGRYVDLSVGHSWKTDLVDLAPVDVVLAIPARGQFDERDRGALLRVVPVGAREEGAPGVRVEVAGAFSERNYADTHVLFNGGELFATTEERLVAAAERMIVPLPVRSGGLWNVLTPSIGISGIWEQARYYVGGYRVSWDPVTRTGQEIDLLGVISLRHGYVNDPNGEVHNHTWGIGARLQYRGIGGVRYDWAEVPQSAGFDQHVQRHGITVFFDPFRLGQALGGDSGPVAQR